MDQDTIFALASGGGKAGIAVYRISGREAGVLLRRISGRELPVPRRAGRIRVQDPENGGVLDDGLALWFPGPDSFTGEDVAELHLHGGRAAIACVTDLLARWARLAEPGEFTRRAFENGKMNLTEVEGLADLVNAETAAQLRLAQRQLQGALGALYEGWRERLLDCLARMEASIDFSDEDLPEGLEHAVREETQRVAKAVAAHLDDGGRGEKLRDGLYIAILGPPNAGKSSLLNALAQRDAAIVSERAGTTRDVIEVHLDLGGYPVIVADTAGLTEQAEGLAAEGVRRTRRAAGDADIKIALFDGACWPALDRATLEVLDDRTLSAVNKTDLGKVPPAPHIHGRPALGLSVRSGAGMDGLLARLEATVLDNCRLAAHPGLTRARHRQALTECVAALERFSRMAEAELAAEDLRLAVRALGRITGRVDVEQVLDRIFAEFCIGK